MSLMLDKMSLLFNLTGRCLAGFRMLFFRYPEDEGAGQPPFKKSFNYGKQVN